MVSYNNCPSLPPGPSQQQSSGNKRKKEADRLLALKEKLQEEEKRQKEHVDRVLARLQQVRRPTGGVIMAMLDGSQAGSLSPVFVMFFLSFLKCFLFVPLPFLFLFFILYCQCLLFLYLCMFSRRTLSRCI